MWSRDAISLKEAKPTLADIEITVHPSNHTTTLSEATTYLTYDAANQAGNFGKISSLVWLSDEKIVLAGSNELGVIELPDSESYSAQEFSVQSVTPSEETILLTRSPFEEIIGWVSNKQEINIWEPSKTSLSKVIGTSASPITGLSIHPSGNIVAFSSTEKEINQVDISTGEVVFTQKTVAWLSNLAYSPDGTKFAGVDLASFRV